MPRAQLRIAEALLAQAEHRALAFGPEHDGDYSGLAVAIPTPREDESIGPGNLHVFTAHGHSASIRHGHLGLIPSADARLEDHQFAGHAARRQPLRPERRQPGIENPLGAAGAVEFELAGRWRPLRPFRSLLEAPGGQGDLPNPALHHVRRGVRASYRDRSDDFAPRNTEGAWIGGRSGEHIAPRCAKGRAQPPKQQRRGPARQQGQTWTSSNLRTSPPDPSAANDERAMSAR